MNSVKALGQRADELYEPRSVETARDLKAGEMAGRATTKARQLAAETAAERADRPVNKAGRQGGRAADRGEGQIEWPPHPADIMAPATRKTASRTGGAR